MSSSFGRIRLPGGTTANERAKNSFEFVAQSLTTGTHSHPTVMTRWKATKLNNELRRQAASYRWVEKAHLIGGGL